VDSFRLKEWNTVPPKPRLGDVYLADGVNWDPGSGAGAYLFDGTNFVLLGFDGALAPGSVGATELASDAVSTIKIQNDAVTFAKMQNIATQRAIGRNTVGSGDPEEVTILQMLNWIASSARGDLLRRGASNWERFAVGSNGQVLTSDGTDPVWAAQPGLVLINTQSASNSATIDFVHGTGGVVLDDTYDAYEIRFSAVKPQNDGVGLWLRVGTGAGPTYQSGAADYAWTVVDYFGQAFAADSSDSEIELVSANAAWGLGNASGEAAHGRVNFDNPEATDFHPFSFETYHKSANNAFGGVAGMGKYNTAAALTAIRLMCSSGNLVSGRFSLYGYVK
jgi:hypothetical protein